MHGRNQEIQACDIWVSGLRFMPAYVLALFCFMPCSKHKHTYVYDKNGFAALRIPICFFLSPSSSLVSCELFVSMRVIHQKQLKLSELYATLYHSLCRWLIPPLYTMFMTTTLCHNCPFCWMLQAVTLCCLMLLPPYARNVSHFTLYQLYACICWYIFP